jgi:hypothetical protein
LPLDCEAKMDHLAFELSRHSTYAKLSPEDLESLGKQASSEFLAGGISLNDAIVKIAKQHPSISAHQVRRIVEFANTETFGKLFADQEKYASDKNIDFEVADPGAVLHAMDAGARPSLMIADPPDYSIDPKTASAVSNIEADRALVQEFMGVDFASPGSEKTAAIVCHADQNGNVVIDRIMEVERPISNDPIDAILKVGSQLERGTEIEWEEHHTPGHPETNVINEKADATRIARSHVKEIPDYYTRLDKMESEASKEAAMGYEVAGGVQQQGAPLRPSPAQAQASGSPEEVHQANVRALDRRIEIEKKKQELVRTQAATQQTLMESQGGAMQQQAQPQQAQQAVAQQPQQAGPVQAAVPGQQKMASDLTKEAINYAKAGRPNSAAVVQDLDAGVSLERIKAAASWRDDYPMANPHGELIRMKQKLAMLTEEARSARDTNAALTKEAQDRFEHEVTQFILGGGNLGEAVHAMSSVPTSEGFFKWASQELIGHLLSKNLDIDRTRAEMIKYEMEKGASQRAVNPQNPIVQSFSTFVKVAGGQEVLDHAYNELKLGLADVQRTLSKVMSSANASARQ